MAIILTAPKQGSLQVLNTAASPQSNYLCNLDTVIVIGNPWEQSVAIENFMEQVIMVLPLSKLQSIGASGGPFTLPNAVDAIASLIVTSASSAPVGVGLLTDNDGNFLITNDGDFILSQT